MYDHPSFDQHERVLFAHDAATGLHAIIAVHSTARGPGAGGSRFWHYGSSVADMEIVATQTRYISGRPRTSLAADGNPSPKTALGVYLGIKAAVKFKLNRDELRGMTIAVQGSSNRPTSELADEMARQLLAEAR